jgi:hypothetical protein
MRADSDERVLDSCGVGPQPRNPRFRRARAHRISAQSACKAWLKLFGASVPDARKYTQLGWNIDLSENGSSVGSSRSYRSYRLEMSGWGGRIRTFTVRINSAVPYRLDHAPEVGHITIRSNSLLHIGRYGLELTVCAGAGSGASWSRLSARLSVAGARD